MTRRADLSLVLITIIWGSTFTVVDSMVKSVGTMPLLALRFAVATIALLPWLRWTPRAAWQQPRLFMVGAGLGTLLFAGFATQTLGLALTTPTRAGFITGLSVVLVPLLGLVWGERPRPAQLVAVVLALVGLVVLAWGGRWLGGSEVVESPSSAWGDAWVLACAFAFAGYIIAAGNTPRDLAAAPLNIVQLGTVALLATVFLPLVPGPLPWRDRDLWAAVLFLGVVATAAIYPLQLWAQRWVSPTRAALIFALEPIFAALFAWWWGDDRIDLATWLGGGLMVTAIICSELPLKRFSLRQVVR